MRDLLRRSGGALKPRARFAYYRQTAPGGIVRPTLIVAALLSIAATAQDKEPPKKPPKERPKEAPQPPPESIGLTEEITVTASRRRELVIDSPRTTTVLRRQEMDRHQARSTPEALLEEPGVWVQRTNYGGGMPFVRGQFGNRILVLVDGIRLNNSTFRAGPNQYTNTIDPLLVDRIEMVRGTGSALYGSDAIGAAINVLTEQPEPGAAKAFGADLRLAGSTADDSGQVGARVRWAGESLAAIFTGSARHFGELRGGRDTGVQHFTGYDEWSASGAATALLAPGHRLTASFQSTRQFDVPRTDRSTPLDVRMFSLQERQLAYLRYGADALGGLSNVRATASFHRQHELADRYRVSRDSLERDENRVGTLGLQIEGESKVAGGPLVAGLEAYFDFIASKAARGAIGSGGLSEKSELSRYGEGPGYQSAGLFAGHRLEVAPGISLHTEARLGLARIDLPADNRLQILFPTAGLPVIDAASELIPVYAGGVHVRYRPVQPVAVNAGLSLGYRAPNMDDMARLGVEGGSFLLPTRGLKPEKALGPEINVKFADKGLEALAAYSYTHVFAALGREGASIAGNDRLDGQRVVRFSNADSARYHAVEAAVRVPIVERLALFANAAWVRGQIRRTQPGSDPSQPATIIEEPAEKVPPLFGKVGLGWRAPANAWFAEGVMRFALRQDRLGAADLGDVRICQDVPGRCTGTPGWAVFTLRGGLSLFDRLRITAALENLTNLSYRMHGSGIDGPGRSVQVLLEGSL